MCMRVNGKMMRSTEPASSLSIKLWEDTYNAVCNKHLKVCNDDGDICACAEIDFNVVDKQAKDLADKAVKQMIDTLPKKK